MKTIEELKKSVLEDGIIDATEVLEIKETIYADGLIDKDEADFLFELNDAVSGKENAVEWQELFVEAITDFLLKDDVSPGEVDAEEGDWLIAHIESDGEYDETEKALLTNIKAKATSITGKLRLKIEEFV
jgi:hypothetical protein|tara:strand:+ start:1827 stop:2216 length:390 start_codon:yes stop_codon:yes gene_type:complete